MGDNSRMIIDFFNLRTRILNKHIRQIYNHRFSETLHRPKHVHMQHFFR
jgi:hypothetical protein